MYPCRDQDYEKFYPIDNKSTKKLDAIRNSPNRGMMCLDWENEGLDLYGSEASGTYSEIDIMIMPCNARITPLGAKDDR